jgi:hypothetical protein
MQLNTKINHNQSSLTPLISHQDQSQSIESDPIDRSPLIVPHMPKPNGASLLPPGEGQDEGINEIGSPGHSDPLTPPLSRRERGFMEQE